MIGGKTIYLNMRMLPQIMNAVVYTDETMHVAKQIDFDDEWKVRFKQDINLFNFNPSGNMRNEVNISFSGHVLNIVDDGRIRIII